MAFSRKGDRGREQRLERFGGSSQLVEAKSGVDPATFLLGRDLGELAREIQRLAPFALVYEDEDAHLDHIGTKLCLPGEASNSRQASRQRPSS